MKTKIQNILLDFKSKLLKTPLLLGWLVIGPLVAFYLDGWTGLIFSMMNLALVGIYAVVIRMMAGNPPPHCIKRSRLELGLAIGLLGVLLLIQFFDFGIWDLQPWQGWISGFFRLIGRGVYGLENLPEWVKHDVFIAVSTTIKQLLPFLAVFLLLGYGWRELGFSHPHWKLTGVLVGITVVFGLVNGILTSRPLEQTLTLFLVGIFVNALPEELCFRGILLPRLEKLFSNPMNALVVSALIFNAVHVPMNLMNGASVSMAVLDIFSLAYPSGLIWGYLYLRTRSIIPGMFWHAANITLGFFLMSL